MRGAAPAECDVRRDSGDDEEDRPAAARAEIRQPFSIAQPDCLKCDDENSDGKRQPEIESRVMGWKAGGRFDQYSTFGGAANPRFALVYTPGKRTALKYILGV